MKLIDFAFSTSELHGQLILQVETDAHRFNISEIIFSGTDKLILIANNRLPVLTLAQFKARCRQTNPQSSLYFQTSTQPLFGYRLDNQYILLG